MFHRIKHLLSWNKGMVVSIKIDNSDYVWIAFQCQECGDISSLCEPLGFNWPELKHGKIKNVAI